MKAEGMSYFTDIQWTLMAFGIFATIFVLTIVMQQKLYSKKKIELIANLPLEGHAE